METETLDKLYLEISQFTKAKTKRELELERLSDDTHFRHREKIIANLHEDAKEIEKSAQSFFAEGKLEQAYGKSNLSQSLRVAANYLDGVSGSGPS